MLGQLEKFSKGKTPPTEGCNLWKCTKNREPDQRMPLKKFLTKNSLPRKVSHTKLNDFFFFKEGARLLLKLATELGSFIKY